MASTCMVCLEDIDNSQKYKQNICGNSCESIPYHQKCWSDYNKETNRCCVICKKNNSNNYYDYYDNDEHDYFWRMSDHDENYEFYMNSYAGKALCFGMALVYIPIIYGVYVVYKTHEFLFN